MTIVNDRKDRGAADKDPSEIEAEIEHTRSEISERLNAIGEKLSPGQLKQDAKQVLNEAKEAVVDKLRDAKDSALQSASESLHEVGERARHAGEVTYGYARENAIPLGLIGLGIGLLIVSGRRGRNGERHRSWRGERSAFGSGRVEVDYGEDFDTPAWTERPGGLESARGAVRRAADETRERAEKISNRAARSLEEGVEKTRERVRELGNRAGELGHRAREQVVRAESRAVDFANDNPLAVGAAALAVGVGIGLLMPPTRREDELLGDTRDRLVDDVRSSVEGVGRAAKETARDVQGALREAPRS